MVLRPGFSPVRARLAVDPSTADGKHLVGWDRATVRVRDAATGETKHVWEFARDPGALGNTVRLSPDRRLLAVWFENPSRPSEWEFPPG